MPVRAGKIRGKSTTDPKIIIEEGFRISPMWTMRLSWPLVAVAIAQVISNLCLG
jgi:hypothetical protein